MLEKIIDLPPGIQGLKATGKISKEDYESVFEPLVDEARRDGKRLRFLYELGPDFEGFTPSAVWEDAKMGLRAMRLFEGCAIVTDINWIRDSTRFMSFMMPCPVRVFANSEHASAIEWLSSLHEAAATKQQLRPDLGVIVVEIKGALRAQDFDALALTADTWIEAHGALQGIVLHATAFPGWENLGSLLRHARFVRDHHKQVRRIALAADSQLAGVMSHLGEHFVEAEVKTFPFDELQGATKWAAGDVAT